MRYHRVTIRVSGFSKAEFLQGNNDLADELRERSWLYNPIVSWDYVTSDLIVQIDRDIRDEDMRGEATFDEVWDCVNRISSIE